MSAEATARLALSILTEPGDPRVRDLRSHLETPAVLREMLAGHSTTPQLDQEVRHVRERARAGGLRWVTPGDRQWPTQLDDLHHLEPLQGTAGAPLGLWVRGEGRLDELSELAVAVVGARSCSTYGAEIAGEIAADLASMGFTVVSGAAYGIDACAHRGALVVDRPTVAVLACGADAAYPRAHTTMLDRIAAEGGLVISEQLPGASPLKHRFLSRNRIIAALSRGTVVVEAALRSGSLNTMHWADLLGRTTMALPGPVTSPRSSGTHAAVRGGKAILVTSGRDVAEELAGLGATG